LTGGPDPAPESVGSDTHLLLLVNGEPRELPCGASVAQLVEALGLRGRRVAVAVNRDVVPRSAFDSRALARGDRVEILEAVGGG
jgi:sulfur carrier protein